MTELWGVTIVLTLACIVFGTVIVSLSNRISLLEANQKHLLDSLITVSHNGKELAESVLKLTRLVG